MRLAVINGVEVAPCIGCGFCCKKAPCGIAMQKYASFNHWKDGRGGCPSLRFDEKDERYYCGEYADAKGKEKKRIERELSIGAGCCSSINTYRRDMLARRKK